MIIKMHFENLENKFSFKSVLTINVMKQINLKLLRETLRCYLIYHLSNSRNHHIYFMKQLKCDTAFIIQ